MNSCDGSWALVPELAHYEVGTAPKSGLYEVTTAKGMVSFRVRWRKDGRNFDIAFAAPEDGSPVTSEFPGIDSFVVRHEAGALVSEAMAGGRVVSRAVRRASGDLLSVLQMNLDPTAGWVRVWQVYRRV